MTNQMTKDINTLQQQWKDANEAQSLPMFNVLVSDLIAENERLNSDDNVKIINDACDTIKRLETENTQLRQERDRLREALERLLPYFKLTPKTSGAYPDVVKARQATGEKDE